MSIEHSASQQQLVTGLAHRMNNILTLFHGYVGLLLDNDSLDKGTRASLAKMKDGASANGGAIRVEVGLDTAPGHTRVGGPDLADDGRDWISISVIDNGHGIEPAVAARMFQPFYSTRKKQQATGLGLNVAAEAVQQL